LSSVIGFDITGTIASSVTIRREIANVASPASDYSASNKMYVDTSVSSLKQYSDNKLATNVDALSQATTDKFNQANSYTDTKFAAANNYTDSSIAKVNETNAISFKMQSNENFPIDEYNSNTFIAKIYIKNGLLIPALPSFLVRPPINSGFPIFQRISGPMPSKDIYMGALFFNQSGGTDRLYPKWFKLSGYSASDGDSGSLRTLVGVGTGDKFFPTNSPVFIPPDVTWLNPS
jgi:hypothetical protein